MVPVTIEVVRNLLQNYLAADGDDSEKVPFDKILSDVLVDTEHWDLLTEPSRKEALRALDSRKIGALTLREALLAQFQVLCGVSYRKEGDKAPHKSMHQGSEMRQAIQAMLVKMQCHSVCFMRTCLERSGKPCCATDSELVRGAAASPGGQADEAGSPGTRSPSRHGGSEPRGGSHAASSTVRSPTSRSPGTRLSSSAGPWQPRPLRHDTGGWDHYMQQTQLAGRSGIAARTRLRQGMDDSHLFPPDTCPDLRELSTLFAAPVQWGGNWGLRNENATMRYDRFRRGAMPAWRPGNDEARARAISRQPLLDLRPRERVTGAQESTLHPALCSEASKVFRFYGEATRGEKGEEATVLYHAGWRRLATDVGTFHRCRVPVSAVDEAFVRTAGWLDAMPAVVAATKASDNPWDSAPPLPLHITEAQFIEHGLAALAALLYPDEPCKVERFCKLVLLPNAPRRDAHPLYSHLYAEDARALLASYRPVLQSLFAHYAGLHAYLDDPRSDHPALVQRAWGDGESALRMDAGEFQTLLANFGLVGARCRAGAGAWGGAGKAYVFSPAMAEHVFLCAADGLESREQGTTLAFEEFVEAMARCAVALHPPKELPFHAIETSPVSLFSSLGAGAAGAGRDGAFSPVLLRALSPPADARAARDARLDSASGSDLGSGVSGSGAGARAPHAHGAGVEHAESLPALVPFGGGGAPGRNPLLGRNPLFSQHLARGPPPGFRRELSAAASPGPAGAAGLRISGAGGGPHGAAPPWRGGGKEGWVFEPFCRNFGRARTPKDARPSVAGSRLRKSI